MSVSCLHIRTRSFRNAERPGNPGPGHASDAFRHIAVDELLWCEDCGSIRDERRIWQAPELHRSFIISGWTCSRCGTFNGEEREKRTDCRACGLAKEAVHG